MSKTKGNVVDPLGVIDESGADALRFALIHGTTPGIDQRFGDGQAGERPQLRQQAVERHPLRRGRPTGDDPGRRRARSCRIRGTSVRPSAGRCRGRPPRPPPSTRRWRTCAFGEVTRLLYDADLERVLRLGSRVREGPPVRRRPAGCRARGDVVDARRRPRHLPAAAPPGDAVRDRGALDDDPASCQRPGLLIVARWPGVGERDEAAEADVEALVDLVRGIRNARAEAHVEAATWLPVDVAVPAELGPTFEALAPAIGRLARARPLARRLTDREPRPGAGAGHGSGRPRRRAGCHRPHGRIGRGR